MAVELSGEDWDSVIKILRRADEWDKPLADVLATRIYNGLYRADFWGEGEGSE